MYKNNMYKHVPTIFLIIGTDMSDNPHYLVQYCYDYESLC